MEPLHIEKINDELSKLNGWDELNQDFLTKNFLFPSFEDALKFINKIGVIAEAQNNYPKIVLDKNKVELNVSALELEGITQKDFDLALLIDEIFEEFKK